MDDLSKLGRSSESEREACEVETRHHEVDWLAEAEAHHACVHGIPPGYAELPRVIADFQNLRAAVGALIHYLAEDRHSRSSEILATAGAATVADGEEPTLAPRPGLSPLVQSARYVSAPASRCASGEYHYWRLATAFVGQDETRVRTWATCEQCGESALFEVTPVPHVAPPGP
jgi:hypothetical protein